MTRKKTHATNRKEELKGYVLEEINKTSKKPANLKPKKSKSLSRLVLMALAKDPSKFVSKKDGRNQQPPKNFVFLKLFIIFILVLIIVGLADIWGAYRFGWQDKFSYQLARIINLPAGTVNREAIGLADYWDDLKSLNLALTKQREGIDGSFVYGQSLREKVFYRLAAGKLIDRELSRYNRSVTDQELTSRIKDFVKQAGSQQQANKLIKDLYGLDLQNFKDKILAFVVARENLQEAITQDESLKINQKAKNRANEILVEALKPQVDFEKLAQKFTEDELGVYTGGEMGWIVKGEVSPELETALFSLPAGAVYEKVIKNRLGYHVVKVEQKMINPDNGKESVKARQVLIRVDVDEYIKELLDGAKIKKFIK
ncbi:MAG: peptidylprolyl isomerase [Patescibacteria group bacterium]